jgi:stress-induced morphogen
MLRLAVSRNTGALLRRTAPQRVRLLSTPSEAMEAKLRDQLDAVAVTVEDVSGGCGAMYKAYVESPRFVGLGVVKQHKLVQGVLKDEIAEMHGFTLKTAKPRGD